MALKTVFTYSDYDKKYEEFYEKYCGWESADSSEKFVDEMRMISNDK